jgi:hypothetical protein
MSEEQIKQRINYLVEHGGLYDDPLEDVRRTARWAFWTATASVVVSLADLSLHLL